MEEHVILEQEWAKVNDATPEQMVACSSGTAALHLAFEALKLPKGSEVLIPDFTMVACARAASLAGLVPRFIDCRNDLNVNTNLLQSAITPKTRAILAVHIYGRRCDMDSVIAAATANDLVVVEDLAEAHGILPHPSTDASCWSFYKNKIVGGEEGGAVAFRDPEAARLARELRSLGFTSEHNFWHTPYGHNYRLANLLAAEINKSIPRLKTGLQLREIAEQWYDDKCPVRWMMPKRDVVWVYDIRIPGMTWDKQAKVVKALNEKGIQARMAFKPMSYQPERFQADCPTLGRNNLLVTDHCREWHMARLFSQEVLYLPVLTRAVQDGVVVERWVTYAEVQQAFSIIHGEVD